MLISDGGDWALRRWQHLDVHRELRRLADNGHGVVDRAEALAVAEHLVLDRALAGGALVRVCPRTYLDRARIGERRARLAAAVRYGGEGAALSHTTALEVWRLPAPVDGPIHLVVAEGRQPRGAAGLRVHRRRGWEPADMVVRDGFPVTRLERSIVDSWPLLDRGLQRAPAIVAVSERRTTPGRLRSALAAVPRLAGRRGLAQLVGLLERGCRSALELWGCERVFTGGAFDRLRWQVPVPLAGGTVYLDAVDPDSGVNLELDGAAHHAGPADRERDLRRDAALLALGYTVVRFTYARLTTEPGTVRREALAAMSRRTGRIS
ncbi:DUF559 domain-containing protein [Dactylosporangium sucinum]|uniref:DUF559 domain-containing protein n=2 Tax=Dactylosporangium sucinum TaxID=1424081 RepID=A0A917X337_9ACTN|nr:hypothetical protein GCM10007977_071560 [Dactylosporangium sucinum]